MNLFDLSGKIAVVTGGYGHLGWAITVGLADAGASVYVFGRSKTSFMKAFQTAPPSRRKRIYFERVDVASGQSTRSGFKRVLKKHKSLDILVNNAIFVTKGDPLSLDDAKWARGVEGVLNSVYRCLREAAPYFMSQRRGKIINVGSMYGIVSPDFSAYKQNPRILSLPHYGAAKAGVIQMTRYFAHYLGRYNIHVNAVSPGPFPNTAVQKNQQFIKALSSRTALGRIGDPEDLVGAVIFLSSRSSNFVTGHNLVVDGGWTSK